ncbi:MAG TPA: hypothetical protein VFM45_09885, partial [Anaeromyxobacteraceae bacterium]|nr:hypothetical protein [Anaeromyxobacteraceae bacterium]
MRQVAGEIASLRLELGAVLGELDRRRRELFDVGLQVRRHPVVVAVGATAVALVAGGLLAVAVRARRERRRPTVRARETRRALARLLDHPERVGARPGIGEAILAAAGAAAGAALARRMVDRLVARTAPRPAGRGARWTPQQAAH